jgi:hypothetical protein
VGKHLVTRQDLSPGTPDLDESADVQVERAYCSRDLVLHDGIATAHDLELRSNGTGNSALSSLILICLGVPSLASAAFG